jgi:hypothetical protein
MSDEAGIHYILPHPSLGLDKCQRIFELRLRKLVWMFIHRSRTITKPLLVA